MHLQAKNVKAYWFQVLQAQGDVEAIPASNALRLPELAKPLVKVIQAHAISWNTVVSLNKKVHVARYNEILARNIAAKLGLPHQDCKRR